MKKIEPSDLPARLITKGVRMPLELRNLARSGGAGPSEGITIFLEKKPLCVPCLSPYVEQSPFLIEREDSSYYLVSEGVRLRIALKNHIPPPPSGAALLHGEDCLGTTVYQNCIHKIKGEGCKFCGIEISWKKGKTFLFKRPEDILESLNHYRKYTHVNHMTITTGTMDKRREIEMLLQILRGLRGQNLFFHIQIEPFDLDVETEEALFKLKEEGAHTVGIHIETPDMDALHYLSPHKGKMGIEGYLKAWEKAVKIFGPSRVSTFIIAGLEKNRKAVFDFIPIIASSGVIPFVLPFRPVPGTPLESQIPPDAGYLTELTDHALHCILNSGLSLHLNLAGCVRCGGCSIMHFRNPEEHHITKATSNEMKMQAFELRKRVFVEEEGLFVDSDKDEHDEKAIHLCALVYGKVAGTVRIFKDERGKWWGGRLAVEKQYRGRIGKDLVLRAMEVVRQNGGNEMFAWILHGREHFFEKLGWHMMRRKKIIGGKIHYLMRRKLSDNSLSA